MHGKTIKLFIMSEEFKNLKSSELSNWTGKAYIGERKHIPVIQKIDELQNAGIYFLLAREEESSQTSLYIGETDNVSSKNKRTSS